MKGDGMNREIKFRIYDKGRKQWVHDTDHAISLFGEYVIFGEILRRPDDSIVSLDELNDLDAMQYTGLKDRNGREIYEGDVVQWDVNSSFSVGVVTFERGCYDLKSLDGERWVCCDWYRGEYEVLGNIYENPELCKG